MAYGLPRTLWILAMTEKKKGLSTFLYDNWIAAYPMGTRNDGKKGGLTTMPSWLVE